MIVAFRSAKDANVNAAFAKRKATIFAATCISSQARRADTSSAGSREAVRPRFAWIETQKA
jgi:hypothetical protein